MGGAACPGQGGLGQEALGVPGQASAPWAQHLCCGASPRTVWGPRQMLGVCVWGGGGTAGVVVCGVVLPGCVWEGLPEFL